MRSARAMALMSGVTSPVSSTTLQTDIRTDEVEDAASPVFLLLPPAALHPLSYFFPSFSSIRIFQSSILSLTSAFRGAM